MIKLFCDGTKRHLNLSHFVNTKYMWIQQRYERQRKKEMNLDLKDLSPDEILQEKLKKRKENWIKTFFVNENLKIAASKRWLDFHFEKSEKKIECNFTSHQLLTWLYASPVSPLRSFRLSPMPGHKDDYFQWKSNRKKLISDNFQKKFWDSELK